jgi:hypothetical protein
MSSILCPLSPWAFPSQAESRRGNERGVVREKGKQVTCYTANPDRTGQDDKSMLVQCPGISRGRTVLSVLTAILVGSSSTTCVHS